MVLIGCQPKQGNTNFEALLKKKAFTVVMFLAPDCPLCITLSKSYNDLQRDYPDVQFLAVHSGNNYEAMELNMFVTETGFKPAIFRDLDYTIAHQFNATITPEFVLIDSSGNTLYQGLLDDRILKLGHYKQQWDKFYLRDAIVAALEGRTPELQRTEPVGCIFEY